MPSPFPGMDPYLEQPDVFPDLHNAFIIYLQRALQPVLPDPYYAATGRRVWGGSDGQGSIGPDLNVLRPPAPRRPDGGQGGVAHSHSGSPRRLWSWSLMTSAPNHFWKSTLAPSGTAGW